MHIAVLLTSRIPRPNTPGLQEYNRFIAVMNIDDPIPEESRLRGWDYLGDLTMEMMIYGTFSPMAIDRTPSPHLRLRSPTRSLQSSGRGSPIRIDTPPPSPGMIRVMAPLPGSRRVIAPIPRLRRVIAPLPRAVFNTRPTKVKRKIGEVNDEEAVLCVRKQRSR